MELCKDKISWHASLMATYSDWQVDKATLGCLRVFHITESPYNRISIPLVVREFLQSDRLASVKTVIVSLSPLYLIRKNITEQKTISIKSCEVDLVTETDQMVEKLLMDGISAKFPDHKFIGEESTAETNKRVELTNAPTWIIDPVDGTMNFVHGFPQTCISIGLYVDKVAEIGIIYNPVLKQLFSARRGRGAFHNGSPIRVSGEKDLNKSLAVVELGTSRDPEKMRIVMQNLKTLTPLVHGMRALGSCALNMCMVAMGAADFMYEFGIHIWDIAAGDLIVREAGGVCIDPAGADFDPLSRRCLCASSLEIAQEVSKLLVQYYPERD